MATPDHVAELRALIWRTSLLAGLIGGWGGAAVSTSSPASAGVRHDDARLFPREHPRRNFTLGDYLQMCRDGAAAFSLSEAARLLDVSRMRLHRWMIFTSVSDEEFEEMIEAIAKGRHSDTAIASEIKRRQGTARTYVERCPHCGRIWRVRVR